MTRRPSPALLHAVNSTGATAAGVRMGRSNAGSINVHALDSHSFTHSYAHPVCKLLRHILARAFLFQILGTVKLPLLQPHPLHLSISAQQDVQALALSHHRHSSPTQPLHPCCLLQQHSIPVHRMHQVLSVRSSGAAAARAARGEGARDMRWRCSS